MQQEQQKLTIVHPLLHPLKPHLQTTTIKIMMTVIITIIIIITIKIIIIIIIIIRAFSSER